jgi:hypothetical protein
MLLCAVLFGAVLAVGATQMLTGPSADAAGEKAAFKEHWRYHDGHWNYWDSGDKRWYHTNGTDWFYNDNNAWKVYAFDKQFGREGFERGEYKAPAGKIITINHGTYRIPNK